MAANPDNLERAMRYHGDQVRRISSAGSTEDRPNRGLAMANYWVVQSGQRWSVKREGAAQASSVHDTQAAAIVRARELIKNSGGGELIVQDRQGHIRVKDTIGRPDPYPPAG